MFRNITLHSRRLTYHLGRHAKVGKQSFKMRGYSANRLADFDNAHEEYLVRVLSRQLDSNPGVFVDIGVNVGQTLLKVLGIDRNRRYIGFEPQVACCHNVEQFLRLNELRNAQVLPLALSDRNSLLTFYARDLYDDMASLVQSPAVPGVAPIASHVQARIGDEVLQELSVDAICAIKIDVEGAELQVLRGLQKTLDLKRPPIVFEVLPNFYGIHERVMYSPDECKANDESAAAIWDLLTKSGYEIFQIDNQGAEIKINRFNLNDPRAYVGMNYIAHHKASIG